MRTNQQLTDDDREKASDHITRPALTFGNQDCAPIESETVGTDMQGVCVCQTSRVCRAFSLHGLTRISAQGSQPLLIPNKMASRCEETVAYNEEQCH